MLDTRTRVKLRQLECNRSALGSGWDDHTLGGIVPQTNRMCLHEILTKDDLDTVQKRGKHMGGHFNISRAQLQPKGHDT